MSMVMVERSDRMWSTGEGNGKPLSVIVIHVYVPVPKKLKLTGSTRPSRTSTKKVILFTIGDWKTKVGCQEIPIVTGKFGFPVKNETGQRLTVLS